MFKDIKISLSGEWVFYVWAHRVGKMDCKRDGCGFEFHWANSFLISGMRKHGVKLRRTTHNVSIVSGTYNLGLSYSYTFILFN